MKRIKKEQFCIERFLFCLRFVLDCRKWFGNGVGSEIGVRERSWKGTGIGVGRELIYMETSGRKFRGVNSGLRRPETGKNKQNRR